MTSLKFLFCAALLSAPIAQAQNLPLSTDQNERISSIVAAMRGLPAAFPAGAPNAPAAAIATGIKGSVSFVGPNCRGCSDTPAPGAIIIVSEGNGRIILQAAADSDGRFLIRLPPGTYSVNAEMMPATPTAPLRLTRKRSVAVVEGAITPVDLKFDSGIR